MKKTPEKVNQQEAERVPVPFDDALKRVWRSPPQHKIAKKIAPKQTKKTGA